MAKRSSYQQQGWRFRREITLGIVIHLVVLLSMVVAAWSNLQKDMAVIQHQLEWLLSANTKMQAHCESLSDMTLRQEYRIQVLEEVALQDKRL